MGLHEERGEVVGLTSFRGEGGGGAETNFDSIMGEVTGLVAAGDPTTGGFLENCHLKSPLRFISLANSSARILFGRMILINFLQHSLFDEAIINTNSRFV